MFSYYFALAIRSLKRNVVLTVLMIAAVGVGIGASMTTLTVFRAMAKDPIPSKSRVLFAVQIDNWGPRPGRNGFSGDSDRLQPQISYTDAVGFMNAHAAYRQAAMFSTGFAVTPANTDLHPFKVAARATYADFFPMFNVPFRFGGPWNAADDTEKADVVVIAGSLNDKLFGGANSIGKTIDLDDHNYRIVGVLQDWQPLPRFYDLNTSHFAESEKAFIPFTTAISLQVPNWGNNSCAGDAKQEGYEGHLRSECIWIQYWAELASPADADKYRQWLNNYSSEQNRLGRFHWPTHTSARNVRDWLVYQHVVDDNVRILVLVSFSFLLVCLLNAMGLMLAKIMGRSADIGVRRALGANRGAIFGQCLIEAGVVGLAGGVLGLGLTWLGLIGLHSLLSDEVGRLTHFSAGDIAIAVVLAVTATTLAGLYPTWRAAQVQPAWQLKAQ
jgi:putative ABC transport system permease protein